jgi:hypothetical protein
MKLHWLSLALLPFISLISASSSEQIVMGSTHDAFVPEKHAQPTLADLLTIEPSASIFYSYARELELSRMFGDGSMKVTLLVPTDKAVMALARKPCALQLNVTKLEALTTLFPVTKVKDRMLSSMTCTSQRKNTRRSPKPMSSAGFPHTSFQYVHRYSALPSLDFLCLGISHHPRLNRASDIAGWKISFIQAHFKGRQQ